MAKTKVEVTGAYVDGNAPGSTIDVEEESATYLESIGYVKRVQEQKQTQQKAKQGQKKQESKQSQ